MDYLEKIYIIKISTGGIDREFQGTHAELHRRDWNLRVRDQLDSEQEHDIRMKQEDNE